MSLFILKLHDLSRPQCDKSKCLLLPPFGLSFGYHLFGTYSIHLSVSIFHMLIIDHQKHAWTIVITPGI